MQVGFIGLGRMGTRMVEKLLRGGHTVVGWNRSSQIISQFRLILSEQKLDQNFLSADDIKSLVKALAAPRVIWIMLPAGEATQSVLDEIVKYTEKGHITLRIVQEDDQFLKVSVADTGIGIKREDFQRIFEEFQQTEDSER